MSNLFINQRRVLGAPSSARSHRDRVGYRTESDPAAAGHPSARFSFLRFLTPRRIASSTLVCLLAVIMLGAADPSARFGRIGHNMMCVCGCAQVLLECNHVGCPDSSRMIGELQDQLAGPNGTGADALILNWFVGKYGATVLAAPIRGGFDNVAWAIPITLFVLATLGTGFLVKLWVARKSTPSMAGIPDHLTVDDSLRDRIRRETQY